MLENGRIEGKKKKICIKTEGKKKNIHENRRKRKIMHENQKKRKKETYMKTEEK